MNVLSLFDGISCGRIALDRAGINVKNYYASEIDKYAIRISKKNYPDIYHLGCIKSLNGKDLPKIDLLIGGSPCQGFSFAGKQLNFNDERSNLFFEFVRLLEECRPKYFLLENVKMKKEYQDVITKYLGVEPIEINSALVSAQNRKRLYWTNIPVKGIPEDKHLIIADILGIKIKNDRCDNLVMFKKDFNVKVRKNYIDKEGLKLLLHNSKNKTINEISKYCDQSKTTVEHWFRKDSCFSIPDAESWIKLKNSLNINTNEYDKSIMEFEIKNCSYDMSKRIYHIRGKYPTLTTLTGGHQRKTITDGVDYFYLSPLYCERLQTLPDNYTEGVSDTQRYKMIGNGWTIDVIAWIFGFLRK